MQPTYTPDDARADLRRLEDPAAFHGSPTIRTAIWSVASHTIRGAKIVRLQPNPAAGPVTQMIRPARTCEGQAA